MLNPQSLSPRSQKSILFAFVVLVGAGLLIYGGVLFQRLVS